MEKIILQESKQKDFFNDPSTTKKQSEKVGLNKFFIFDENNQLVREGKNIVLNIGRKISSSVFLDRSLVIPAEFVADGVERTMTPNAKVTLAGFGIGDGAAAEEDVFSPREPLPNDEGFSQVTATNGQLPFSVELPLPSSSLDGEEYVENAFIKKHVSGSNPVFKTDETDFVYVEHTLLINKNEMVGHYFNEVCTFFEITEDGDTYYVPYSKFSFAGLPNLGGKNSYTLLYGTYL